VQLAKEYMMRAVQSDPTDTHSLYQLGVLYYELLDVDKAVSLSFLCHLNWLFNSILLSPDSIHVAISVYG